MASEASEVAAVDRGSENAGFLGWRMVGVAFVAQFVSNGVTLMVVGNFIGPVAAEFGVARNTVGMGVGVAILTMGLAGIAIGKALDAGLARPLMTAGAILSGAGLILAGRTDAFWQLALCWVLLISLGAALFGALPSMTIVSNWFVRKQGLALGLAIAGATLASYPFTSGSQYLIDEYGWRIAASALGAICLVLCVPVFALFAIGKPEQVGQIPDGEALEAGAPAADASDEEPAARSGLDEIPYMEARELAAAPKLWIAAIGFGLVVTSPVVMMPIPVTYGEELGFTAQQATVFFAMMTPFSLLGKIVLGRLADVAPLKPIILFIVAMNIAVWFLLSLEPGYTLFLVTGVVYGIGISATAPIQGVLLARLFGRANFARATAIGGMATFPLLVGMSLGSQALVGYSGSYQLTFMVQIAALTIGGVLLAILRIPTRSA